uniref:Calmodulin-binding domain-containing protein n=1 Tax=Romanomermis culicivorax TaxID=13658 RepID=A0A915I123_ROMCU
MIKEFRKVKWDQRKLAEQGNALIDLAKLQNDTYTMIYRMQQSLEKLTNQIDSMRRNFDHNQRRTPTNRRSENCRQNDRYC